MKRTSIGRGSRPPTRITSRSASTRNIFACVASGISPSSSSNTVPPFAASNKPTLVLIAPVNAPFSCPKSSLSSNVSDNAAQLMRTNGRSRRGDARWISSANTSFPEPVSPSNNTLIVPCATALRDLFEIFHRAIEDDRHLGLARFGEDRPARAM
jgi:hypothetical protein